MGVDLSPVETGIRVSVNELLQKWVDDRPDRICCGLDDTTYTFADMDAVAGRLAAGLASIGVQRGDRVATLAPNRPELLELFFGLARMGAIQVPLNAYLKGAFLQHQLSQSRVKVIIVDGPGREAIEALLPELPELAVIVHLDGEPVPGSGAREISYRSLLPAGGAPAAAASLAPTDPMSILYTSGTTGLPKGCVLSHGYYARCGDLHAEALEMTDADVLFASLPLFHAGGRLIVLMAGLYRGIPARFESSFSARNFFTRAGATEATVAIGVGAMGAALLASEPCPGDLAHSLRTMMVAPMSLAGQHEFRERFGIEPWTDVFGQTECIPITITGLSSTDRDPAGCGIPARDLEVALLDDDGEPVAAGEAGEICVRPREDPFAMFNGYWRPDGSCSDRLVDGWHHTGDSARRLPSGALAFVDRKKDSMRRRGENVSSLELEAAINQHPDVVECAVHAVASTMSDDDIKAVLVLHDGAPFDPAVFFDFLRGHLPYFAIPRYLEVVAELPRNAVGRVLKHVLRAQPHTASTVDLEALGLVVERGQRR